MCHGYHICQKNCWCKLRMMMTFTEVKGHQRSNVVNYATKLGRKSSWCKSRMTVTFMEVKGQQRSNTVNNKWPCAIKSCHNRDMPKISSKYAFAHLQWHSFKSVYPTIVKVYFFGKLFLQEIQKWLYFCGRGKSKNIMADQKLKKIEILIKKVSHL